MLQLTWQHEMILAALAVAFALYHKQILAYVKKQTGGATAAQQANVIVTSAATLQPIANALEGGTPTVETLSQLNPDDLVEAAAIAKARAARIAAQNEARARQFLADPQAAKFKAESDALFGSLHSQINATVPTKGVPQPQPTIAAANQPFAQRPPGLAPQAAPQPVAQPAAPQV